MNQEEKQILLNDLSARLPYGVQCKIMETNETKILASINYDRENTLFDFWEDARKIQYEYQLYLSEFKPYLYPLSSISNEIIDEIYSNTGVYDIDVDSPVHIEVGTTFEDLTKIFDILNKHHIDYRGMIPKGLAIDATGKNIY
jgi:hypothetical protein